MMTLFSLVELADQEQAYRGACIAILRRRVRALLDGLGLEAKPGPLFDNYYGLIDLKFWLAVRAIARDYVQAYRAARQAGGAPAVPEDI
jgi:hypothetical protein